MGVFCSYRIVGKFVGKVVQIIPEKNYITIEILTAENEHMYV